MTKPEDTTIRLRPKKGYIVWLAIATFLCLEMAVYSASAYILFDTDSSRVNVRGPEHYGMIITHVFTGTVALAIGVLQFWPRLRQRRRLHRAIGNTYFALILPSAVVGLILSAMSLSGLGVQVPLALLAVLWFISGIQGVRAARAGDHRTHRVWMIRNFALTAAGATGRLWAAVLMGTIGGDIFDTAAWLSFVPNMLIAEWWVQRSGTTPPASLVPPNRRDNNTTGPH